jgi:soluble lytic murein transglycosylase
MSTTRTASAPRAGSRPRSTSRARSRRRTAAARRRTFLRRLVALVLAALAGLAAWQLIAPVFDRAVTEVTLPLRHDDIIRQQASDKDLDPTLIAGVIYAESRFRDGQVSSAGAQGLMQLTPATAKDIAHRSGGVAFELSDLATPQVNIAYGSWYLDHLLDKYAGNEVLALAAYNGGQGNVDRWIHDARQREQDLRVADIPFPETREYVRTVLAARADYRREYPRELGL